MWQLPLKASNVMEPVVAGPYPERPGEPDCVYYMRTGLCGFGMSCRFNHPHNRKMAALLARGKGEYPERIGQPECQYYLKMGTCKFGITCKYHHPRDKAGSAGRVHLNVLGLPLRPGEKECAYYMRTGSCKYSTTCKFHHPQPAAAGALMPMGSSPVYGHTGLSSTPASHHYPTGFHAWPLARAPYLPGARLQGPSSYGPIIFPPTQGLVSMSGWSPYQGPVSPLATTDGQQPGLGSSYIYGAAPQADPLAGIRGPYTAYSPISGAVGLATIQPQSIGSHREITFPERPGQPECQYYMKTGDCKFRATCRYHHPKDRTAPTGVCLLGPLGLPLRPGAQPCAYYSRYGICKFGPTCKFDHPLGELSYSPSSSSLADLPVAPYAAGSPATSHVPLNSSEALHEVPRSLTSTSNSPSPASADHASHRYPPLGENSEEISSTGTHTLRAHSPQLEQAYAV
ncbi:hypothetical protein O6H91_03G089800 [Diphasiastrum complanatum]|nr:hypothetical protein O6H91_03G089800 [Diphasiastrum complanatum]